MDDNKLEARLMMYRLEHKSNFDDEMAPTVVNKAQVKRRTPHEPYSLKTMDNEAVFFDVINAVFRLELC